MVGIVAGALLLAGAGTYLLAGRRLRADATTVTLRQARQVAAEVPVIVELRSARLRRGVLKLLYDTDGLRLVVARPGGALSGTLPEGLAADDLRPGALRAGQSVAGVLGNVSYAAVPVPGLDRAQVPALAGNGVLVVLLVQRLPPMRLGLWYLVAVSGGALLVAFLVALVVSRRISRPLEDAVATTGRISQGDLGARVPDEPGRLPELASLTASINAMAEALARSRTGERQFLLSVSHDLRTPLTSILGYAEAIGDGTADDPRVAASVVVAEARRLERLVGDLLELARLDSRQFSLHPEEVDVAELVRAAAEGLRPPIEGAGLVLAVPITPGAATRCLVDPDRLRQVVANLVENAFKFARTTVQVWAGRSGGDVMVTVDDDGPGISPQDQRRVFDRFVQRPGRDAPSPRQAGSGLGLAIVGELVGAMGGSVRVVSPATPAGGTRMEVRLPPSGPDPPAPAGRVRHPPPNDP